MISSHWLEQRRPYWLRLEGLLDRASEAGVKALTRSELQDLGLLYRQIATDLSTVREDPGSVRYAAYLNQLLARAHHTIYATERPTPMAAWRFLRETFPRVCREHVAHCLVAVAIFLAAGLLGAALTSQQPDFALKVLGPEMIETIERREMWTHSIVAVKPLASSAIMTNNMSVAFTTFASGITGGVGTIYLMLLNGLMLGVVGAACASAGMSLPLWSFVAPHGVLELPAIFIAGGAGLRLGQGLLFPGVLPRRDSLARAGTQAIKLVVGTIPLLIIAGIVEAFISPTDLPVASKFAVAASLAVLLAIYLSSRADE